MARDLHRRTNAGLLARIAHGSAFVNPTPATTSTTDRDMAVVMRRWIMRIVHNSPVVMSIRGCCLVPS